MLHILSHGKTIRLSCHVADFVEIGCKTVIRRLSCKRVKWKGLPIIHYSILIWYNKKYGHQCVFLFYNTFSTACRMLIPLWRENHARRFTLPRCTLPKVGAALIKMWTTQQRCLQHALSQPAKWQRHQLGTVQRLWSLVPSSPERGCGHLSWILMPVLPNNCVAMSHGHGICIDQVAGDIIFMDVNRFHWSSLFALGV